MRSLSFTAIAFVIVMVSMILPLSRGTFPVDHPQRFHVEQRRSVDHSFELTACPSSPDVLPSSWRYDHTRAMRASLYASSIVVETHSPRHCLLLSGPYHRVMRLGWVGKSMLAFVEASPGGIETPYVIDMETLTYERRAVMIQRFPALPNRDAEVD